jgi:hypothetical protein
MSYSWFRLYHEFATDPKIQMLSEAHQRRFVMLLCLRCSNGDVTLHDDQVAFQLRIAVDEWKITKTLLLKEKLITEANQPVNWDKRQFKSDHSNQRVEKHRKRYSNGADPEPDPDTDTKPEKIKINGQGFLHANGSGNGFGFRPELETCDRLRDIAPGWDQHFLIGAYNDWKKKNGLPTADKPQDAFLGWAKKFTKGKRP